MADACKEFRQRVQQHLELGALAIDLQEVAARDRQPLEQVGQREALDGDGGWFAARS